MQLLVDEGLLAVELGERAGAVALEERAVQLLHLVDGGLDGRVATLLARPALFVGEPAHLARERRVAGAPREQRPAHEPARAADHHGDHEQHGDHPTSPVSSISRAWWQAGTTLMLMVGSGPGRQAPGGGSRREAQRPGDEPAQRAAPVLLVAGDGVVERRDAGRDRVAIESPVAARRSPPWSAFSRGEPVTVASSRRASPSSVLATVIAVATGASASSAFQPANAVSTCSTIGFAGPPAAEIARASASTRAYRALRPGWTVRQSRSTALRSVSRRGRLLSASVAPATIASTTNAPSNRRTRREP